MEKIDTAVTEEEVEADLNQQRENNSRMVTVERAVEDGDEMCIRDRRLSEGKEGNLLSGF